MIECLPDVHKDQGFIPSTERRCLGLGDGGRKDVLSILSDLLVVHVCGHLYWICFFSRCGVKLTRLFWIMKIESPHPSWQNY